VSLNDQIFKTSKISIGSIGILNYSDQNFQ